MPHKSTYIHHLGLYASSIFTHSIRLLMESKAVLMPRFHMVFTPTTPSADYNVSHSLIQVCYGVFEESTAVALSFYIYHYLHPLYSSSVSFDALAGCSHVQCCVLKCVFPRGHPDSPILVCIIEYAHNTIVMQWRNWMIQTVEERQQSFWTMLFWITYCNGNIGIQFRRVTDSHLTKTITASPDSCTTLLKFKEIGC